MFPRDEIEAELRRRVSEHEPLHTSLAWLRATGAPVVDALEMLEGIGLRRKDAEYVLGAHPDWKELVARGRG